MPRKAAADNTDEVVTGEIVPAYEQLTFTQLAEQAVDVVDTGEGLPVVKDLNKLVGVSFIVVSCQYRMGEVGEYWVVKIKFQNNTGAVFVAGGQLGKDIGGRNWVDNDSNLVKPVYCPNGLRVSKYLRADQNGEKTIPAESFYIDDNPPAIG